VISRKEPVKNAFTVDLEDWYQGLEIDIEDWGGFEDRLRIGTERLLALFDEAGVCATFFVLGYAAERAPSLMREIRASIHWVPKVFAVIYSDR
jgi:peptidoglycan/xylan/chitin deacetylase (PgdA/CDA1 family)